MKYVISLEVEANNAAEAVERAKSQFREHLDGKYGWVDYDDAIVNSITEV